MSCADLSAQLRQTYGFQPSKLDAKAQTLKVEQMDAVWRAVKADPGTLGPCLKHALASTIDDDWFLFDGGQLLVAVDPSRDAKQLLLRGLSRVSLDDVDLRAWIAAASQLGLDGFDTSALGRRWLLYPDAAYFLPEHGAYQVDRGNGALFLFGTLEERFATPVLAELSREAKGQVKEIATWLLMSQATPEALRALAQIDRNGLSPAAAASITALQTKPSLVVPRTAPKTSRPEFIAAFTALLAGDEAPFNRLVESVPDGERDLVAVCTESDLQIIRKVRRYYAAKNTPHSIDYYNQFSQIIMTLVWNQSGDKAKPGGDA